MISNLSSIILISASIINTFIIALLVAKGKINLAIGLATLQALAWIFRFLGVY